MIEKLKLFLKTENKKQYKTFKTAALIVFALVILFLFAVKSVSATNKLEELHLWSNFKNTESLNAWSQNSGGYWSDTVNITYKAVSFGSNFQPLSILNPVSGVREAVITSSNNLKIVRLYQNNLINPYELSLGSPQLYQGAVANSTMGLRILLPLSNHLIQDVVYNSSGLFLVNTINVTAINSSITQLKTGIVCSSQTSPDSCYFTAGTSANNVVRFVYVYKPETKNLSYFYVGGAASVTPLTTRMLPVYDWDNDGSLEIAIPNLISNYCQNISVWDTVSKQREATSTVIGSCSGSLKSNTIGELMFWNGDGYANADVFGNVGWLSGSVDAGIKVFRLAQDGTTTQTQISYTAGAPHTGTAKTMAVGRFFNLEERQLCWSFTNTWNDKNSVACINTDNMSVIGYFNSSLWSFPSTRFFSADYNLDSLDEIINGYQILDLKNRKVLNFTSQKGGDIISVDLNSDGYFDLVSQVSGKTWFATTLLPETVLTLNGRSLSRNFANPVCKGTSLQFFAYDCSNPSYKDFCHYLVSNNLSKEALYTGCANTLLPVYTGGFQKDAATVSCFMNKTGNFKFKVYLVTESAVEDYTHYYDVEVNVINGTLLGIECNQNPYYGTFEYVTPEAEAVQKEAESSITFFVDTMTANHSPLISGLIMIALTIGIIFLLIKWQVANPIVFVMAIFCLWIALALMQLISFIYPVLLALVIGLISVVYWVKGGTSQ